MGVSVILQNGCGIQGPISAMTFCRLAWKEEVVKVIEALVDQCVGRIVGGIEELNGLQTGSLQWG